MILLRQGFGWIMLPKHMSENRMILRKGAAVNLS
jgi:hypothetical protein